MNADLLQILSYRGSDEHLVSHKESAEQIISRSPESQKFKQEIKTP
jgi:hypothetical protein